MGLSKPTLGLRIDPGAIPFYSIDNDNIDMVLLSSNVEVVPTIAGDVYLRKANPQTQRISTVSISLRGPTTSFASLDALAIDADIPKIQIKLGSNTLIEGYLTKVAYQSKITNRNISTGNLEIIHGI